jgi:hypothetical protein
MASIINASSTGSGGIVQTADASGVLQLQTNGTTAVTVAASANVGIGEASPTSKLVVNSGASTTVAGFNSTGSTAFIGMANSGATTFIGNDSTSGSFVVQTPGSSFATKLKVDANGYVTTPFQPMFSAFATNGTSLTTDTTPRIMPFQTEATDVGGNYNTTTSRFTAPVAGTYFFQFYCLQLNGTSSHFYFYKNGAQLVPAVGDSRAITTAANEGNVAGTGLFTLAAGDYVQIYYSADSGGNVYGGHGGFSGFLVG